MHCVSVKRDNDDAHFELYIRRQSKMFQNNFECGFEESLTRCIISRQRGKKLSRALAHENGRKTSRIFSNNLQWLFRKIEIVNLIRKECNGYVTNRFVLLRKTVDRILFVDLCWKRRRTLQFHFNMYIRRCAQESLYLSLVGFNIG